MATNWPPAPGSYSAWPPPECGASSLSFSDIKTGIDVMTRLGYTRANPTSQENRDYFRNVSCDEGHPCQGIMLVSSDGTRRYPFAYCTGAVHKTVLVLWVVGISTIDGTNCYDLGWNSGDLPA